MDSDAVGLLLKDVTNSRVGGCLIRDDRPNANWLSVEADGGRGNMVVGNYFGGKMAVPKDFGLVEQNYNGK